MKKIFLYAAMLATVAVSCSKIDDGLTQNDQKPAPEVKMITETISGSRGTPTKVTIANSNGAFAWTAGDNIAVHVTDGSAGQYVFTSDTDHGASGAVIKDAEHPEKASFTIAYPDGYSRDAFALFPSTIVSASAANYGQSGSALDVTLPATYTLAQVTDETSPCPMIAANATGSKLTFYQLCGLLRLTVKSIPADATGIVIRFPGKKVNGNFSIADPVTPGTSTIATGIPADGEDCITINFAAGTATELTVNIPLPTGDYDDVFITPVGSSTKVAAVRHIKAGGYTVDNTHARKLTTTLVSFSVSATKKVIFAPGNLQATTTDLGANWNWHFAANQYDRILNATANTTITGKGTVSENGTIDLFGYSTDNANNYFGIIKSKRDNYYSDGPTRGAFKDWSVNNIGDYSANFWYTMEKSEWEYLLNTRTSPVFAKVQVNGKYGLLIFPDNFTWDTSTMGNTPSTVDNKNANYNSENCSIELDKWNILEAAGVVFLPGTGYRPQNENSVSNTSPAKGYYWFSDTNGTQSGSGTTYDNNSTFYFYFGQGNVWATTYTLTKRCGAAVRLARGL